MKEKYLKFSNVVYKVCEWLSYLVLIIMMIAICTAVIARYLPVSTPKWTNETGTICIVWLCFLSATLAIRDGTHIRMTLLEYVLPKIVSKILHCMAYLALLVLYGFLLVEGWASIELTHTTILASTQLPSSVMYGAVFVSAIFGIFLTIDRIIRGDW